LRREIVPLELEVGGRVEPGWRQRNCGRSIDLDGKPAARKAGCGLDGEGVDVLELGVQGKDDRPASCEAIQDHPLS
jgi:hypothetical protein